MKTRMLSVLVALAAFPAFGGYVNFANTSGTGVITNSTGIGGGSGLTATSAGGFYYATFIAPPTVTSIDPSLQDLLSGPWSLAGIYATNTSSPGRLNGGIPSVPSWGAGQNNSFIVVGWSASVAGPSWSAVAAQLSGASLNNGVWNGPNWGASGGFLGASGIAQGAAGSTPGTALSLFGAGTINTGFSLLVIVPGQAPAISNQPLSQTVPPGQSATFTVSATGTATLAYQWQLNGSPLSGANSSAYTVLSVQSSNTGTYTVVVSNSLAAITSAPAILSLPTTNTWTSSLSGKWEATNNWLFGLLPGPTTSAYITNTGTKTVTVDILTDISNANTLTVCTLSLGSPLGTNTLALSNAGTNAPLHVLYGFDVAGGGNLNLVGSSLQVDQTLTVGTNAGFASATVSNAVLNAGSLELGGTTGGQGNLLIQDNSFVTVNSNITVVSGSLSTTNIFSLTGGSLIATNGLIQIGPLGRGTMLITGGSHIVRQIHLGSTNGSGTGLLHISGGSLRILGNGIGPGDGFVANTLVTDDGDFNATGTSLTIGSHSYDASAYLAGLATVECDALYVGNSPGSTGTCTQTGGVMTVYTQMIVGDLCPDGTNGAFGFETLGAGTLYVTNAAHNAILDVRNGSFLLNTGGTLVVDTLIVTNPCGQFIKNGGTLIMNNPPILDPSMSANGTGQSNTNALLAGTDPLDPSTAFRILSIVPTNATSPIQTNPKDLRVDWTTVGGRTYILQAAITGGFFTDVSPSIVASGPGYGVTNFVQLNAFTGASPCFYRLRTAVPIAADTASDPVYNDLDQWNTGDNGGFGFSGLTLNLSPSGGNGGFVVWDSSLNGSGSSGNINTEGKIAWGLYADSGVLCEAIRPLNASLQVGQLLKVALDTGSVNGSGKVGLTLRSGTADLFEFYFLGGGTQYLIHDASGTAVPTGVPFTDGGLLLQFTLTGTSTYSVTITPLSSSSIATKTGNLITNNKPLNTLRFYNSAAGPLAANYFYFNCLLISNP